MHPVLAALAGGVSGAASVLLLLECLFSGASCEEVASGIF